MSDPGATDPAVIAAVIGASVAVVVAVLGQVFSGRRETRARRRTMYAEAYSWYTAYKEYPYVIRRRQSRRPDDERLRISAQLTEIQQKLSFYDAWVSSESKYVSGFYSALLAAVRGVAGQAIKEAWLAPPTSEDREMNVEGVDLSALQVFEAKYLKAVRVHLAIGPVWMYGVGDTIVACLRSRSGLKAKKIG